MVLCSARLWFAPSLTARLTLPWHMWMASAAKNVNVSFTVVLPSMNILKSVQKRNPSVNMSVKELIREWNIQVKESGSFDFSEIVLEIDNQKVLIFLVMVFNLIFFLIISISDQYLRRKDKLKNFLQAFIVCLLDQTARNSRTIAWCLFLPVFLRPLSQE